MEDKDNRYVRNHNAVKEIGVRFGFAVCAFDPDWTVQTLEGRKHIPDWLMGRLAVSLKLEWIFDDRYSEESRKKQIQHLQTLIKQSEVVLSLVPKEELDQLTPHHYEDIKTRNSNLKNQIVSINNDIKVMKALKRK